MLNMLRADFYRLFRTRGFWILQAVMVGLNVLEIIIDSTQNMHYSGIQSIYEGNVSIIMYYILPLILFILGTDFTGGTLKDCLTLGNSRRKYFFSKLVMYGIMQVLLMIETYFLVFLSGAFNSGVGTVPKGFAAQILYQWIVLSIILFATMIAAYFLVILTKSSALSMIAVIVFPLIVFSYHRPNQGLNFLKYVDSMQCIINIRATSFIHMGNVSYGLIGAAAMILVGVFASASYLDRMDL